MSLDLKLDIIYATRKGNCPFYKTNSHACWGCPHSIMLFDESNKLRGYGCGNLIYDKPKKYKVKPRKAKIYIYGRWRVNK